MPPIAIAAGMAAAGAAGSSGGKKGGGNSLAAQQLQVQQQQLAFGKEAFGTGMKAWQPATDYWKALLSGDRTMMDAAVGPTSDVVRSTGAATGRNIASSMPAGGERNLAVALNSGDTYNNLSRLYAGVQPTAANALGQLSTIPIQAGTNIMGQAAPNIGAAAGAQANTANNKMSGAQGLGSLLYRGMNKNNDNGGGGGSGKNPVITNFVSPNAAA